MNSYYEKFIATGEVKCIDEEIPFEIPVSWEWCRLRDIIKGTNAGKSPNCEKRPKNNEEWGVLTTTAIQENDFLPTENKVLPQNYKINLEHSVKYGDILITRAGPINRTGIVCMVDKECDKLILSDKTVRIDYIHNYCNPAFIVFVLNCPAIHELLMRATVGMAASQVNISQENIQNTLIPFPGISEQNRIVGKIINLNPMITKYDFEQQQLEKLNVHLRTLMKKSILHQAIQGKLVPQIAEEVTSQELLEQIGQEKQNLIKEGKLKKSALIDSVIFKGNDNKYYERIGDESIDITEEIPFDLPDSWTWVRFGQYVKMSIGKTPPRGETKYWANGLYPWISISDMSDYGLVKTTKETVSECAKSLFGEMSPVGTLIMSFKLTVGRTSLLNISAYHNEAIISIYPFVDEDYRARNYLFHILPIISNLGDYKDAIKGKTLNSKSLNNLLLPLPPLYEQGRIVAMIEQLFDKFK